MPGWLGCNQLTEIQPCPSQEKITRQNVPSTDLVDQLLLPAEPQIIQLAPGDTFREAGGRREGERGPRFAIVNLCGVPHPDPEVTVKPVLHPHTFVTRQGVVDALPAQYSTNTPFCPPTITCPGENIATTCTDAGGTVVEFTASAVDNATVVCEPPSGATFPPGLTTITCTATDASGNTATCSFQVEGECGGLVRPGDCDGNGEIALPEPSCHEPASGSMIRSMVGLSKDKKRPYATAKSYI